ncbi:MAG: hypothetical protein V3U98_09240 [Acidobacteriota bacterium]
MKQHSAAFNLLLGLGALLGSATLASSFVLGTFFTNPLFLILVLFALMFAPANVRFGRRVQLSALQVVVLAAVVLAGIPEAVVVAGMGALCLVALSRPRPEFHQAVAIVTGYPLEALLAGWAFTLAGGRPPAEFLTGSGLVALVLASLVYFLAHTWIAATLVGFGEGLTVAGVWLERYAWSLPAFLSAGALAGIIGLLYEWAGLHALVLLIPFVLLLLQSYRVRAERNRFRTELERLRAAQGTSDHS